MQLFSRRSRTFRVRLMDKLNTIEERMNDMATRADLDTAINRLQTYAVAVLDAYEAQKQAGAPAEDLQAEVDRLNLIADQLQAATAAPAPTPAPTPAAAPGETSATPTVPPATPEAPAVSAAVSDQSAAPSSTGADTGQGFVADTSPPPAP